MKTLRYALAALAILGWAAFASDAGAQATKTLKDGNGNPFTLLGHLDTSGNFEAQGSVCDPTTPANCQTVSGGSASVNVTNSPTVNLGTIGSAATAALQSTVQGPAGTPGAAASNSLLMGCENSASAPGLTGGQQVSIQCDSSGRAIVNIGSITAIAQGSTTSGLQGALDLAAATSTPPTLISANTYALYQTLNGALRVGPQAVSSGGASVASLQVANNTTSVSVDASPGVVSAIEAFNNSATIAYLKLYDAAQGSTTCGSGTPKYRAMIPAQASGGNGFVVPIPVGMQFSTAITACFTTGFADSDTTAPAASAYVVNVHYF